MGLSRCRVATARNVLIPGIVRRVSSSAPNLFHFATSELSQDAVLAWLLAWADASHADTSPALHDLGLRLLRSLFERAGVEAPPLPCTVQVRRQLDSVDVVALVGHTHVVLIEDKTHTSEHSDQLRRYADAIKRRHPDRTQVRIYLKTGEQCSFAIVDAARWRTFLRRDLLGLLRAATAASSNDVVREFHDHLRALDAEVESYRHLPSSEWSERAWQGFFQALKPLLREGEHDPYWGYVANPRGGFMGLWWGHRAIPDGVLYLQLEQQQCVVKVDVMKEAAQAAVRAQWVANVNRLRHESDVAPFVPPPRLGRGRWMTVARLATPYLVLGSDGKLELEATADRLRTIAALVQTLSPRDPQGASTS